MAFVDASAIIALMTGEADADDLALRLERHQPGLCSPLSIWETVAGLCRSYAFTPAQARAAVDDFVRFGGLRLVPIGAEESETALAAYALFGKGRHPAALNMGDCFAYACARANRVPLLFKGNDFALTDIAVA